jgi:hypothetical protein
MATAMATTIPMAAPAHAEPTDRDAHADSRAPGADDDLPPGVHRERRAKKWPLLAGGLAFGGPYVLSVATAALFGDRPPVSWLNAPVVGPWIFVAQWKGAFRDAPGMDNPLPGLATFFSDVILILDGGVQAAGLVLLSYGAASHETVIVEDASTAHAGLRIAPVPTIVGAGAPGLGVVGTF